MKKISEKKLFLLDMDGTIYLDENLFDGTIDFLNKVREKGGKYLFVTNNSSKSVDAYVEKLDRIGIRSNENDFLTSTDAAIIYLNKNHSNKKFYSFGTRSFTDQLKESGINVTTERSDDIYGIIMGNDTELSFKKLEDACILLKNDIKYIATNPDWVCPTSYGYVPDCGSVAEMLFKATGKRPLFIGKPQPDMLLLGMQKYGFTADETLMVGDRVYTDIASGYNAGVDTVFVLSGEGTMHDVEISDIKPTYIMKNIKELLNFLD